MIWLLFVASIAASWMLVGAIRALALRTNLLDVPNERSAHTVPTPRGGGSAIVMLTVAAAAVAYHQGSLSTASLLAWLIGGGLIAIIGLLDDRFGVAPATRLAVHCIAALLLVHACGETMNLPGPTEPALTKLLIELIIGIGIVWSINLFNFMDGIDGLAAMQCVFVVGSPTILLYLNGSPTRADLPLIVLAGAAAGFLIWNFPPAKIFMGDVGSGFIGFAIPAIALTTSDLQVLTIWTWLVLHAVFVADATVTLLVRLLRGEKIYTAHSSHAYQHLARRWKSHRQVSLIYLSVNLLWCLPWAFVCLRYPDHGVMVAAATTTPLALVALLSRAGQPAQ